MSSSENVLDRVSKIIVEQLGVKAEEVTPDASIVDDLGADSLDSVELLMALEEEFNLEIADKELDNVKNIQEIVDYIQKRLTEEAEA